MRVILADDAPALRALVSRAARAAGHEIACEAADTAAVLAAAVDDTVDAIVIDGRLPPEGAPSAIERIRRVSAGVHIVVVATLEERDLVRAAVAAGASGTLLRPFRTGAVAKALSQLANAQKSDPT